MDARIFGGRNTSRPGHRPPRPLAELLEPRTLFAVGSVDPSFGANGQVTVNFPAGPALSAVRDTVAQSDGKLIIVGTTPDTINPANGATDAAVARLNADGSTDTTFGTGGVAVLHREGNADVGEDVELQPDGKVVITGFFADAPAGQDPTTRQLFVARFNADGTIDTTFAADGVADATLPASV